MLQSLPTFSPHKEVIPLYPATAMAVKYRGGYAMTPTSKGRKKVFIDPGHRNNKQDFGAVGPTRLRESEVVMFVAHCVKMQLEREFDVYMSRYGEEATVGLTTRANMANREGSDIFVSIHTNAHSDRKAHGVETYHFPGSVAGRKLAERIQPRLVQATGDRDRGIKTNSTWTVLRATRMPAVLVELPFISNPIWESKMRDCEFRLDCASAIADGIRAYFKEV